MALRGTLTHRKIRRLAMLLKISPCFALGIVESLWHVTAEQAPTGAIGTMSDADIAMEMFYDDDPAALTEALVAARLVDRSEEHRLVIHDWHIHSDDATDNKLSRAGLRYASGEIPRMKRMSATERTNAMAKIARNDKSVRTTGHGLPDPATNDHFQSQSPEPESSVQSPEPDIKTNTLVPPAQSAAADDPVLFPQEPKKPERKPEDYMDYWNRERGALPAVVGPLSDARRTKLKTRITRGLTPAKFKEVIEKIRKTPYCLGDNTSGWRVSFDFLIANDDNIAKILGGNYDRAEKPKPVRVAMNSEIRREAGR